MAPILSFTAGFLSIHSSGAAPLALIPGQQASSGIPWWVWLVLLALVILLFILWWTRRDAGLPAEETPLGLDRTAAQPTVEVAKPAPAAAPIYEEAVSPGELVEKAVPDDLKIVEGIGPKIAAVLANSGIVTFAQLAAADTKRLEEILRAANFRIANPATWPEQGRLAAAGDWQGLQKLQDELKGGLRA